MVGGDFAFTPGLLLSMWAAGTGVGAALVVRWRIVGPGYVWLTASTVAGIGAGAWYFERGSLLAAAVVAAVGGGLFGRKPTMAAGLIGVSGIGFVASAMSGGAPLLALTGSAALGGITAEMLLGHWYLISPQMPRWALRKLDVAGAVGMGADAVVLIAVGALTGAGAASAAIFGVLAAMSVLLMVGVWFSLNEPSYPGVMAATGLSYLAVLTSLGATAVGRTLLDGSGSLRFLE